MSKTVRFHNFGPAEVLTVEDIEVRDPGPNEIRIKVAAIGLNFAEVMWRQNEYIETPILPSGLGYEASGYVEKVGPGVKDFKVGDKVASFPAHNQGVYSSYGELVIMPGSSVTRYPEKLSEIEAASYLMAYLTGYFALHKLANLNSGATVVITAASSSTGIAAIELAKAVGAKVIATTRTSKKTVALKEAGADVVIATEEDNLVERVLAETDGKGAEVIYDAVAGKQLATLGKAVKRRGHLVLYGFKGGETEVPVWDLFVRAVKFHAYKVLDFTGAPTLGLAPDKPEMERAFTYIHGGIEKGVFRPRVDSTFDLKDIVAAHRYMESGTQIGKIVVTT
ncbi:MAG TPA: zinc-dependent alcohol dehydrogenase family protein [Bryobacteraceae bacterium]|nr:zinc-dependent alcohol dehydrogenase family protein [Bryobacteraceae bacterium]